MDVGAIVNMAKGILGGMKGGSGDSSGGDPDKNKPKDVISDEMKLLFDRNVPFDNKSSRDLVNAASKQTGVNPSLLYSSAFQEGMNKAMVRPDEHSEAYDMANPNGELNDYKVDGFYNYGVDKFGENYEQAKKYLPGDFANRFKFYDAINEANEKVHTAAFKNNGDALMAKAAMMRLSQDEVQAYAKEKGLNLDDKAANYFTLARYNSSPKNYRIMMDEYMKAADKNKFIDEGQTTRKNVHKNIYPRLSRVALANQLLTPPENASAGLQSPATMASR